METVLITLGLGLVLNRKWGALGWSMVTGYFGLRSLYAYMKYHPEFVPSAVVVAAICLIPTVTTIILWRTLVWGKVRDVLYLGLALVFSAITVYAAHQMYVAR